MFAILYEDAICLAQPSFWAGVAFVDVSENIGAGYWV